MSSSSFSSSSTPLHAAAAAVASSSSSSSSSSSPSPSPLFHPPRWLLAAGDLRSSSPSRADGMAYETEHTLRKSTCLELTAVGRRLFGGKAKQVPMAAEVFFQRFYSRRSVLKHDRMAVALACLLVAGKVTDFCSPARTEKCVAELLAHSGHAEPVGEKTEAFVTAKERLLAAERFLLYVLEYDLEADTPHPLIEGLCRDLGLAPDSPYEEGALRAAHEALRTTLCVQYDARTLALGCLVYVREEFARLGPRAPAPPAPERWAAVVEAQLAASPFQEAARDVPAQIRETTELTRRTLAGAAAAAAGGAGAATGAGGGGGPAQHTAPAAAAAAAAVGAAGAAAASAAPSAAAWTPSLVPGGSGTYEGE
jgi:hypothetical protein